MVETDREYAPVRKGVFERLANFAFFNPGARHEE
jgi:hypothetical protein